MWNIDTEAAKQAGFSDADIQAYQQTLNNAVDMKGQVSPTLPPTPDRVAQAKSIVDNNNKQLKSFDDQFYKITGEHYDLPGSTNSATLKPDTSISQPTTQTTTPQARPARFDPAIEQQLQMVPPDKQDNMRMVAQALKDEGILTPNVMAYTLATIQHETAGTYSPIEEIGGREQAIKLGYDGGPDYYGRGYIQLTGRGNYDALGNRIGDPTLSDHPERALDPQESAKITAAFIKDRGVADLANKGDFYDARGPVNGTDQADLIANYANRYLSYANQPTTPPARQLLGETPTPTATQATQPQIKPTVTPTPITSKELIQDIPKPQLPQATPEAQIAPPPPPQQLLGLPPPPPSPQSVKIGLVPNSTMSPALMELLGFKARR